jgi:hypothetical protein
MIAFDLEGCKTLKAKRPPQLPVEGVSFICPKFGQSNADGRISDQLLLGKSTFQSS